MFKFFFAVFAALGAASCTGAFTGHGGLALFVAGLSFMGVLLG